MILFFGSQQFKISDVGKKNAVQPIFGMYYLGLSWYILWDAPVPPPPPSRFSFMITGPKYHRFSLYTPKKISVGGCIRVMPSVPVIFGISWRYFVYLGVRSFSGCHSAQHSTSLIGVYCMYLLCLRPLNSVQPSFLEYESGTRWIFRGPACTKMPFFSPEELKRGQGQLVMKPQGRPSHVSYDTTSSEGCSSSIEAQQ